MVIINILEIEKKVLRLEKECSKRIDELMYMLNKIYINSIKQSDKIKEYEDHKKKCLGERGDEKSKGRLQKIR